MATLGASKMNMAFKIAQMKREGMTDATIAAKLRIRQENIAHLYAVAIRQKRQARKGMSKLTLSAT